MSHKISRILSFCSEPKFGDPGTNSFRDKHSIDPCTGAVSVPIHHNTLDVACRLTSLQQLALPEQIPIQSGDILKCLTNTLKILNPDLDFLLVFLGHINL